MTVFLTFIMCHCSRIPMTLILALGSIILALGSMILALGSMILTLGSMILALGSMILALGLCQGMSTFINVYLQSNSYCNTVTVTVTNQNIKPNAETPRHQGIGQQLGSGHQVVNALNCQLRGQCFDSTCRHFKTW